MAAYDPLYMLIDGEWIGAGARGTQAAVDPATGETIGALRMATPADLDRALETSHKAFAAWRKVSPFERGPRPAPRRPSAASIPTWEPGLFLESNLIESGMVLGKPPLTDS